MTYRVATVRENILENEIFSRSGKNQGILLMAGKLRKDLERQGKVKMAMGDSLQKIYLFCSRGEKMYFLMS